LDADLVEKILSHPVIVASERSVLELMADEANFTAEAEGLIAPSEVEATEEEA